MILAYGPPFLWILKPEAGGYPYKILKVIDSLLDNTYILNTKYDFQDLFVLLKNYQYHGPDIGLPEVIKNGEPAPFDSWYELLNNAICIEHSNYSAGSI